LPAAVFVITTLPPGVPMASTNDVMNQPTAGMSPPRGLCMPQAPRTHVTPMATAKPTAATGKEPRARLYWKQPIKPSSAPNSSSMQ